MGFEVKIPAGRQVAIVSTDPLEALAVACLIPRFIEPQQGRILIDGEDIAWVTLDSLRAEVILVGGKDPFISGSVRDNICGGNPNRSLRRSPTPPRSPTPTTSSSGCHRVTRPIIGEQGEQLDPGQSFRLGLARAILRKPALLIIEEPAVASRRRHQSDARRRLQADRPGPHGFVPRPTAVDPAPVR